MAIFGFFKMAGRHHLGLLYVRNFKGRKCQEGPSASSCQISRRSIKQLLKYMYIAIFYFSTWRPPPCWIFKMRKFEGYGKGQDNQNASPCQSSRPSVKPLRRHQDLLISPILRVKLVAMATSLERSRNKYQIEHPQPCTCLPTLKIW